MNFDEDTWGGCLFRVFVVFAIIAVVAWLSVTLHVNCVGVCQG